MKLPGLITISIAIIAISLAYYYVIFLPEFQKEKLEFERNEIANQKINLDFCLKDAENKYKNTINSLMKMIEGGNFPRVSNPEKVFDDAKATLEAEKDECFRKY